MSIDRTQIVAIVLILVLLLVTMSLILLIPRNKYYPVKIEIDPFEKKVLQKISDAHEKVEMMVDAENYLSAAILSAEVAATEELLIPHLKNNRDLPNRKPSLSEESALFYFRLAGYKEVYENMLRLKYPNWDPDSPS